MTFERDLRTRWQNVVARRPDFANVHHSRLHERPHAPILGSPQRIGWHLMAHIALKALAALGAGCIALSACSTSSSPTPPPARATDNAASEVTWSTAVTSAGFNSTNWFMNVTTSQGPQQLSGACQKNSGMSSNGCALGTEVLLNGAPTQGAGGAVDPNLLPAYALTYDQFAAGPIHVILSDGSTGATLSQGCSVWVSQSGGGTQCSQ